MSEVSQPNEQLIAKVESHLQRVAHKPDTSIKDVWLRALLEERIELRRVISEGTRHYSKSANECADLESQLQQTREERDRTQATLMEVESAKQLFHSQWWELREELEQVKAERDSENSWKAISEMAQREAESLRTELSAKDKVLEMIAKGDYVSHRQMRVQARSILSQYGNTHE